MTLIVGLIGAGRMGKVFAHTLAFGVSSVYLAAVSDRDEGTARNVAACFGAPVWTTDYHELLAQPDIEAVVIATSTASHQEIVQAAAAAGKHIFCEKLLSDF